MTTPPQDNKPRPKYVESVKAAANLLGYSESLIQYLKDQGNPAWRGCRCHLDELEDWIDENGVPDIPDSDKEKWDIRIARERHRKLKIQNDLEEAKTINREEIKSFLMKLAVTTKDSLKRALEDEMPPLLAGKRMDEIRAINKTWVDKICDHMQAEIKNLK